ncbi:MAG: polysaccharide biosynthesis protein [Hyphomonadaceae bacterium]|nr:polysaccharide biosynthesis protein [Hyphomonadaceae bacterium]
MLRAQAHQLARWLVELDRYPKRVILAVNDFILLNIALWLALSFRYGQLFVPLDWPMFLVLAAAPFIGVATFFQMQVYRMVTRFMGTRGITLMAAAVGLSALYWGLLVYFSGIYSVPRTVVLLYPVLATALIWLSRQAAASLLKRAGVEIPTRVPERDRTVLIYGAGSTGVQLLEALEATGGYRPIAFVDPRKTLARQYVSGLRVVAPERVGNLIERFEVDEVLLAMPKAQRRERQAALRQLEQFKVRVRTLPAIEDVAAGRVTVSDLRPVDADDLLGRDPVPPNAALLARNIQDKSVMVTGAGGSIGSELVRQIIRNGPKHLVLLERSENHLYEIDLEVETLLGPAAAGTATRPTVVSVLGSILDGPLMRAIIEQNGIQTIFHAAAFKHVPLVEHNPVAGLRNNTFGTAALAEAAIAGQVERFVLISTDKAVRPTSIMGASKRLAEMILQAHAAESRGRTVFTMVRFGNVLNSSGSVVQRFRRQIEAGGPVTVTHPGMVRYFMSIPEAAGLVIQAGAMAAGGDVFVLDMGQPVKIDDLARSMIRLMGQEVRDEAHPDGDIAIQYVGTRDGEKLYEELLIGENVVPTEHPRIMRSQEPFLQGADLKAVLADLDAAMGEGSKAAIQAALARGVENYCPARRDLDGGEPREAA